jgi:Sec-independent protein translocase protein TatA
MFGMTGGEIAIVLFIFALVWGAGVLPRLGEYLGDQAAAKRKPGPREGR